MVALDGRPDREVEEVTIEEWRPVPEWEGLYEVSSLGRLRSLPREFLDAKGRSGTRPGRIIGSPGAPPVPYPRALLQRGPRKQWFKIHTLVALAFFGPRPEGMEVRHLDGDPENNAVSNLAYGTSTENKLDCVRHGTHHWANKTHCPRNHPYDDENTRMYQGRRFCKACARERTSGSKEALR